MKRARSKLKVLVGLTITSALVATAGLTYASTGTRHVGVGGPHHYSVQVGGARTHALSYVYTSSLLHVYVGDSVTFWTPKDTLEPHTVTFGPRPLLTKLSGQIGAPVPQKNGPPVFTIPKKAGLPSASHVYAGGFANSGILWPLNHLASSWTVRFMKPGRYYYYCLIHYPFMNGVIVVHPKPAPTTSTVNIIAGNDGKNSSQETFFPKNVTVHVGDTVVWHAEFHTVTFAPDSVLRRLEHHFIERTSGKPYAFVLNEKAMLPSSTNGCGKKTACTYGGGYLNSGLILGPKFTPSTFSVTFTHTGTYHYGCLVHLGMVGNVRVVP